MPPQSQGWRIDPKLEVKSSKRSSRNWLSEDICKLILGGDQTNLNLLLRNPISYKMIINLNMFCASMKNRIRI